MRIAVLGCGPAGMAAALLLARDGHAVTVFERFAAARPVGSGLMIQPTGYSVLRALGLDAAVLAGGARIERLFGRAMPSGRTVLDVRYAALGGGRFGIGVHRGVLFQVLHDAVVAAGIPVVTGRAVAGAGGGAVRFLDGEAAGGFDLVLDALGTGSPLAGGVPLPLAYGALWASLDWPGAGFDGAALEQRYVRASRMAGVLPLGHGRAAFFWSLRVDALEGWRAAGLGAWKQEVTALWPETLPLLDQVRTDADLTFARYTHRTVRPVRGDGVIRIGDAWHAASPQLGQGANMALLDAYALALALRRERDPAAAVRLSVRLRRRHVWLYQAMSAMFTPAYQGDGRVLPFMRDRFVGPLAGMWPASRITAAMVAGVVGDPLGPLGLG